MPEIGQNISHYSIVERIGKGGMGEVYRAKDLTLGRDVAIKVLPEEFARDADRVARFQREAKLLASLNHPNIAAIYGLEESSGTNVLVLELVEGETLADQIKRGPIPVEESLKLALQIAEALEAAHEKGVIHRDLKPANIKVTPDGKVKVLDFGLAKAFAGEQADLKLSNSQTLSNMATQQGVILGTAAYMSPEQAKGKPVDKRADIWAFGCILYECLTGKRVFEGETVTETLAAVLTREPEWENIPAKTRSLLRRCLERDPKKRLRDIGDVGSLLESVPAPAPVRRQWFAWTVAAFCLISAFALAFLHFNEKHPGIDPMRFQIPLPEQASFSLTGTFSISPDGRHLAFSSWGADGYLHLWIRSMNSLQVRPLPNTSANYESSLFWSPDSRFIAYGTTGSLKKINVEGGPARTVCDFSGSALGGSWNSDGVIIFGSDVGGLMRVSATGGVAPLTTLDSSRRETYHVMPTFLPDGNHFLYKRNSSIPENTGIYVGSLNKKPEEQDSKIVLATSTGVAYVPSSGSNLGHLIFMREGTLWSQPFDERSLKLAGESVLVAEHVGSFIDVGHFSVSKNGVLVYRIGGHSMQNRQLTWFDRSGKFNKVGEPTNYKGFVLSPDGNRVVVKRSEARGQNLWLFDFTNENLTRFTYGESDTTSPVWSADGEHIIYRSFRNGKYRLYQKPASKAQDEVVVLELDQGMRPTSWSPDGQILLCSVMDPKKEMNEFGI
jgi:eukaryotic-like serine/threonine-protein kinase